MQIPTTLPKTGHTESFRAMGPLARREARNGLLFVAPWIVGFLAFTLLPMLATLWFSFTNLGLMDNPFDLSKFAGLKNYATFLHDSQIWNVRPDSTPGSFWVTLRYGLIAVPVSILLPMGLRPQAGSNTKTAASATKNLACKTPGISPHISHSYSFTRAATVACRLTS